uniref:C2H2-type domain-containing protein n=1 Tax=Helicotheca tamesis TaxID=374047 RepID=A0A7S2HQ77_9STRA
MDVQVYDADSSHALVEAHVRFYAIRRHFHAGGGGGNGSSSSSGLPSSSSSRMLHHNLKFDPMRIINPDDELGAVMFPSTPTSVSHHIDAYSPILPPSRREFYENGRIHQNSNFVLDNSTGLNLREVDSYTGNRDGLQCAVCGETYGTTQNLVRHIRMCQLVEEHDDYPVKGSHRELDVAMIVSGNNNNNVSKGVSTFHRGGVNKNGTSFACADGNSSDEQWYDDFREYLTTSQIEILCVFEAIEPLFSGTFQCMQSYTIDDIVFGREFAPCMLYGEESAENERKWWHRLLLGYSNDNDVAARVDLDRFHEIVN